MFAPTHRRDRAGRARASDRARFGQRQRVARGRARKAGVELGYSLRQPFRIGHTQLRYCSVDHPLAPTLVDRDSSRLWLNSLYTPVIVGAAVFLLLCLDAYLTIVERATLAAVVTEPLTTFAMLLFWSGSWALASRVIVSRFHFPQHVTIACGAIVGFFCPQLRGRVVGVSLPISPGALARRPLRLGARSWRHWFMAISSLLQRCGGTRALWAALAVSAAITG